MDILFDLDALPLLAEQRYDEFIALRDRLQDDDMLVEDALDAQVARIAAEVSAQIDCTQCANCCRNLHVCLVPADAARLARGFDVPVSAILDQYVDRANGKRLGEWATIKGRPCPLLNGKLCSVYEHRPETCREYPNFTPDFRWTMTDTIGGAALCPIIYNTLCAVSDQIESIIANARLHIDDVS